MGEFVGSTWKGIPYVKLYAKPKDPKSAKQLAVRKIFKNIAFIASRLSEGVLKPYTFPKPEHRTAYSHMLHINGLMFANKEWNAADLKIFEGPLDNPGVSQAALSGRTVKVAFDAAQGRGADEAVAVVYDEEARTVNYAVGTRNRGSVKVALAHKPDPDADSLHAYLAFIRPPAAGSDEKGVVSFTAYKKVETA
jgi:hypothetical protein